MLSSAFDSVASPGREELDVTSPDSVKSYFARREVDLLICNAGVTDDALLLKTSEQSWDDVIQVNLKGAFLCAQAAVRGMAKRRGGHIIFISSYSALHPPAGQAAYATSKAALHGLAKSMAKEFGSRDVRVNVVLPGFLETKMTAGVSVKRRAQVLADHALGRFNTTEAVAKFVHTLHYDMPHTSGQIFNLDSR